MGPMAALDGEIAFLYYACTAPAEGAGHFFGLRKLNRSESIKRKLVNQECFLVFRLFLIRV